MEKCELETSICGGAKSPGSGGVEFTEESLYPEEVLEELKRLFGREIERIPYDQLRFWLFVTLKNKYLMKDSIYFEPT